MTKFPVFPVVMPKALNGQQNGKISTELLRPLRGYPKGALFKEAATAFNCLQLAAFFDGIELTPTSPADTYRSYERQESTFLARYSPTITTRVPPITRVWNGKKYWLKRGFAPSASPGTSNHGWGLAVDIANAGEPKRLQWLLGDGFLNCNALRYGFTWEGTPGSSGFENWHIRYVCGDDRPSGVTKMLKSFPELEA